MATDFSGLEAEADTKEFREAERAARREKFMLNTRYNLLVAELNAAQQAEEAYRLLAGIAEQG